MNLSIIKKDFMRNKAINISLLLFIVLAAVLMSVGTMITIQLFGSIDTMYKIAKPPHYMQMHVGDLDKNDINKFADSIDYVEDWQTVEMVNIYGGNIWITKSVGTFFSMSDSLLDIGLVKQNQEYDLLLNMENKPFYPSQGEIGVPIIVLDRYDIKIGDTLTVKDGKYSKNFVVSSYVRDSQMNSTLTSSTRFLINEQDHNNLKENTGEVEYLIEFYFNDTSQATEFQTAYENAGMPANGQGITYAIIKLVSSLSDSIMVVVIILVSFFVIFVVFLCLRFTILTALEEEIKSIGTMRAIGMSHLDISQIYMTKYKVLAITGCSIGYIISIIVNSLFSSHITETFGAPKMSFIAMFVPILTVFFVYLLEVYFCKRIMRKMKKVTVVEALVSGGDRDVTKMSKLVNYISLSRFKNLPVNLFVGTRQVMLKSKTWFVMFFVMLIATSMMLVPLNLLNTFKSPQFITYMGQSMNDIIVSVSVSEKLTEKYHEISVILDGDEDVMEYSIEARIVYEAINKDGEWINVHVDCSNVAKTELQYLEGKVPINENEIALSAMNANEMGVNVGDTLTMRINGEETSIIVSGIYQDVTSGGYTAKMARSYDPRAVERYSFFINVNEGVDIEEKVDLYNDAMGMDVKVTDMEEFVDQTLGGVTNQLSKAVFAVAVMAMCLVALITVLFLKLQTAKEYSQIAIMKAIGFSILDIRKQYLVKVSLVSLTGVIAGTLLANHLGEVIVSSVISIIGLGISKISFVINPVEAYFLYPLAMLTIVMLVTWYCSAAFKKYNIINLINE